MVIPTIPPEVLWGMDLLNLIMAGRLGYQLCTYPILDPKRYPRRFYLGAAVMLLNLYFGGFA